MDELAANVMNYRDAEIQRLHAWIAANAREARADDIMKRRLWFPRFIGSVDGKQQWVVYSWVSCSTLRETTTALLAFDPNRWVFESPVEALLAAEDWWVEHVEPHRGR